LASSLLFILAQLRAGILVLWKWLDLFFFVHLDAHSAAHICCVFDSTKRSNKFSSVLFSRVPSIWIDRRCNVSVLSGLLASCGSASTDVYKAWKEVCPYLHLMDFAEFQTLNHRRGPKSQLGSQTCERKRCILTTQTQSKQG
jgi:hypothetical protein